MEQIEELLDPQVFYRANRQCIIHIEAIQSVRPHDNQKLTVLLKVPLKMEVDISREKAPVFKKWLDRRWQYLGDMFQNTKCSEKTDTNAVAANTFARISSPEDPVGDP